MLRKLLVGSWLLIEVYLNKGIGEFAMELNHRDK